MSFALPLALLLGLAVAFPALAHALRRGRTTELQFPAAHLAQKKEASSQERRKLQDRALFSLRFLLIIALSVLGASPFVRCSQVSLARQNGASVAATFVIDDSASMRALSDGKTRLERARATAMEYLKTAQPGDAFAIVLAGTPARILSPFDSNLESVRQSLRAIAASDRATDLAAGIALARSLQKEALQAERPIVVLSDFSLRQLETKADDLVVPEIGIRKALTNCAIVSATRIAQSIQSEIACTGQSAIQGRFLQLLDADGQSLGKPTPIKDGALLVALPSSAEAIETESLSLRITEPAEADADQIKEDDESQVLETTAHLTVGVRADQSTAGLKTGSGTVLQAGIESLSRGVRVDTLSLIPETTSALAGYAALLIDDPSGFTPDVRAALTGWLQSGGVGLLLLGPNVGRTPLGSSFSPFIEGGLRYSSTQSSGAPKDQPGPLGPLSTTWADLQAKRRVHWDGQTDATALASWDDGAPLVLSRRIGKGLALSTSLPSSVDRSDFALRPAFLELLSAVVSESATRKGALATPVGERWPVTPDAVVSDPFGKPVSAQRRDAMTIGDATAETEGSQGYVEPAVAGKYVIKTAHGSSHRYAMRHRNEHVAQPNVKLVPSQANHGSTGLSQLDASRHVALLVLLLAVLELGMRGVSRRLWRAARAPEAAHPA